ncbi:3-phosphoshikimate 1-carboxyvinyltransferase [Basilea psittacipulmonis DSM 24701]|uniref:Multifunctional fusion protein n=1 Tax=Basilea psittacipulmonis DSM 24701 TaxID=1072685 RepID=A0A077DDH3_9BURK|nr:3-phosphoshikimate 1-carboxyvinyltransferase [Basilea psittacipulmonis DSM 24701]
MRQYYLPYATTAQGAIVLPGSKSISNRILLLSALSIGDTHIQGLLDSDDTRVMIAALQNLGVEVQRQGSDCFVRSLGYFPNKKASLHLGNAGTAFRPLTAALALSEGEYTVDGVARMRERPIGDLVEALLQIGADITYTLNEYYPPLHIQPATLNVPETIKIQGNVSSQFLSAMLMVAPLLAQKTGQSVHIEVLGELISKPYVRLTLNLMARFGVEVQQNGWTHFYVSPDQTYRSPGKILVEGDASSASYFMALGTLGQGPVRIYGINQQSIQGDIEFAQVVKDMGATVLWHDDSVEIKGPALGTKLKAFDKDFNLIPDAAMTAAVLALYADGPCTLRNIASWRVKETDRIEAMKTELRKLGAKVESGHDWLTVYPIEQCQPAQIDTYDDHRMAMCFSLTAFFQEKIVINDPECVSKTFPHYFAHFASLVRPEKNDIPIITIDGPSASGKGTVAKALAKSLSYSLLESGALYRLVALKMQATGVSAQDTEKVVDIAICLDATFEKGQIYLEGRDVSDIIQTEEVGALASQIASQPPVREALLARQKAYCQLPGLVAEGRDMGTVVFPQADLKIFWEADVVIRAKRRVKQLNEKGICVKFTDVLEDLEARDARDYQRTVAPLTPALGAYVVDSSNMSVEECVNTILNLWQRLP